MVNEVIKKIEEQQKNLDVFSPEYQVGEQLKDICRSCPEQAELIFHDLDNPKMSIVEAEKKIQEFAKNHRRDWGVCVPPGVADRILRDFYKLAPASAAPSAPKESANILDIADFL